MLQRLSCRFLLGPFLGRALRPPHKLPHLRRRQSHFDRKCLLVFGAFFFHQRVNRLRPTSGLQRFLQGGLEIHHRHGAGLQLHLGQFRLHNYAHNKVSRHQPAAIEIECRQDSFQCVDLQARLVAATAFFFAAAETHVMSDLQLLGYAQQMPLSYKMSAKLRKLPFLEFRKAMEQRLTGDQAEHGISEKLEHLVIAVRRTAARRTAACAQRLHLARLRAVGQRLFEEFPALELVTQAFFQRHDFVFA